MAGGRLADAFRNAAPSSARSVPAEVLEHELRARIDAGRAAWPSLEMPDGAFVAYVALHSDENLPPSKHAAEMWLACACADGCAGAAAALQASYRVAIERAAARVDRTTVDDAVQVVLASLLVRDGASPARIAAYGGRSALSTWLATVAARAAIKLRRRHGDKPHDSISRLIDAATEESAEMMLLRAKYTPELEASLRAALDDLEPRSRVLLRLHHAEAWSLERLAKLYAISRATCARRLAAARQELYDGTRRHLRLRLQVTTMEFASIAALVGGGLDVSLARLLAQGEAQGAAVEGEAASG